MIAIGNFRKLAPKSLQAVEIVESRHDEVSKDEINVEVLV
jgi:hypothetical protein